MAQVRPLGGGRAWFRQGCFVLNAARGAERRRARWSSATACQHQTSVSIMCSTLRDSDRGEPRRRPRERHSVVAVAGDARICSQRVLCSDYWSLCCASCACLGRRLPLPPRSTARSSPATSGEGGAPAHARLASDVRRQLWGPPPAPAKAGRLVGYLSTRRGRRDRVAAAAAQASDGSP